MKNLIIIDSFFSKEMNPLEQQIFNDRIKDDSTFAKDVAFYIQAKTVISNNNTDSINIPQYRLPNKYNFSVFTKVASIAAVVLMVFGLVKYQIKNTAKALAETYLDKNWSTISAQMSANKDELSVGIELYNDKKYKESLFIFEKLEKTNNKALTYKGIAEFKLNKINESLRTFKQLESKTDLYANPGQFYQALILLKRANKNDQIVAKNLLQKIVSNHQEGELLAKKILRKLD